MKVTKLNRLRAQPVGDRAHKSNVSSSSPSSVGRLSCRPGELTDDQATFSAFCLCANQR